MKLKLGFNFNWAAWKKRDRGDFIFGGIMAVSFLSLLFFVWVGSILYRESFQKRMPPAPAISGSSISDQDLDIVLRMMNERENKFNEILRSK